MQQDCKIANVLTEQIAPGVEYRKMYYNSTERTVIDPDGGGCILLKGVSYDFATYFNALPIRKWRQYTVAEIFKLHVEIEGNAVVDFKRIDATHGDPQQTVLDTRHVVKTDDYETIDYEFSSAEDADMVAFEIVALDDCVIRNCYYYTTVDSDDIADVHLALATTTFKQEKYVKRNIDAFKKQIRGCGEAFCENIDMLVIDNGQTLDAAELEGDGVRVFPNPNTGGAGGFARGMIEAMQLERPATHVLLMDDDIEVSPESFKRSYWLTALRNEEYKDAFISGAMLSYEERYMFAEDVGWIDSKGICGPVKPRMDFRWLRDVVKCDSLELKRPNMYAAWWFCCIPVNTIKRVGLPLPVFFQFDDAEYGNRAKPKFITMTGLCVWHMPWGFRYKAHATRYYGMRNAFIAHATTGVAPEFDFINLWKRSVVIDMTTLNYGGVELSLNALEDYLEGPEAIMDSDRVLPTLQSSLALNEKLEDLGEYHDPSILTRKDRTRQMYKNPSRTMSERVVDKLSGRGHRLPKRLLKSDAVIVPHDAWTFPSKRSRLHRRVLSVTPDAQQGVVRTMDKKRYEELDKRYRGLLKRYEAEKDKVELRYVEASLAMTSEEFWRRYLGLDR